MHPPTVALVLPPALALAVALAAAAADLRSRRIPNALTLGALAAGLAVRAGLWGVEGVGEGLLGLLAAGVPAALLFRLRAMGGGDVKLLAGCGALLGPAGALELLLATAVAGGILAAATVAARRAWAATALNLRFLLTHWMVSGITACPEVSLGRSRGVAVPYGVAVACGALVTLARAAGAS